MAESDKLVIRAREDIEALGQLYEQHYEMLFRYCLRRVFAAELAEDVTSEVFLKVARHIGRFGGRGIEDFRNWLYAIANNEVNAHLRKSKRRKELLAAAVAARSLQHREQHHAPDNPADWPIVYEAMMRLNVREQALIALRFFEGLKTEQMARIVGCKSGACRVALSRAIDKLRRELSRVEGITWETRRVQE